MESDEITREEQLRRAAERQGLRLSKSDDGKYGVENLRSGGVVVAGESLVDHSLDLDGVEELLFSRQLHGHPLRRDEDYENAITPHAPHNGDWGKYRDEGE